MTGAAEPARSPALRALGWMALALASFGAMTIAGRELARELNTFEIMGYRSLIGVVVITALMAARRSFGELHSAQPGAHVIRHTIHFAAQNCWFYGIATIPLAQLTALEFTNPIWVALFAPFLLGERLSREGKIAVALGFLGVLIVARPGLAPLDWGHAAGLGAAFGFAITNILTRKLSWPDSTLCILFWMTLSQAVMGFGIAGLWGGITLFSWAMSPWVLFAGICGLTAHFGLTRALSVAPATVVAPMEFLRLPVIALAGMLLYGEPLELAVFLGAATILAGNLINLNAGRRR